MGYVYEEQTLLQSTVKVMKSLLGCHLVCLKAVLSEWEVKNHK